MAKINRTHHASAVELFPESDRHRSGIVAVEFVFILPVLMLFLFGIIEFGIFFMNKHVITNASREGARAGIVSRIPRLSFDEIETVVNNYCKEHLVTFGEPNEPKITCIPAEPADPDIDPEIIEFGKPLTVEVTFNYDFLLLPIDEYKMRAITVMKYE